MKYLIFILLAIFVYCQVSEKEVETNVIETISENKISEYSNLPDLNSDSINDTINYNIDEDGWHFTLRINSSIYRGSGEGFKSDFEIVDINKNDTYQEIAIKETGHSDAYTVQYFHYNGEEIKQVSPTTITHRMAKYFFIIAPSSLYIIVNVNKAKSNDRKYSPPFNR